MAAETITTALTSTYLLDASDTLFVAGGGSVLTTGTIALGLSSAAATNASVLVAGSLTSVGNRAIFLQGSSSSASTGFRVSVEVGGQVTSGIATAIDLVGSDCIVVNAGNVSGSGGIQVSGAWTRVTNAGGVQAFGEGIKVLGDQSKVINSGTISAGNAGLTVEGSSETVMNSGTITSSSGRGILVQVSNLSSVENTGTILARQGITILALNGATNFVANSGSVQAEVAAVELSGYQASIFQVQNSGTLQGQMEGIVSALPKLVLNNLAGGMITGQRTAGVSAGGDLSLQNDGTILATASGAKGIALGAGALDNVIQNHGEITALMGRAIDGGDTTAASSTILRNFGTVTGAILGGAGQEFLFNRGTIQSVNTQAGADILRNHGVIDGGVALGDGADVYRGRFGELVGALDGGTGADLLLGGDFDDDLAGGGGADTVDGGGGNDILRGNTGFDTILGGAGDDLVQGGADRDDLSGGTGNDIFVFNSSAEIGFGNLSDRIQDFAAIDVIDVSSFMASAYFLGAGAFTAGGDPEIRYTAATGIIEGDENGDGLTDWSIWLVNKFAVTGADFLT